MSENKEKRRSGGIKRSFSSRQFKSGAYSSFITIIVVALVVIINLLFSRLELSTDLSSGNLFTLSKETKNIVKGSKDKISIYYMVQDGAQQEHIERVVNQYKKLGSNVSVVRKDPVKFPNFTKQYVDNEISDNDVVVVNDTTGAAKYVSNGDMYYSDNYSYYGQGEQYLDAEGQITSAIQYVLSSDVKKIYMVTGNGEAQLSDDLQSSVEKMNMDVETLELVTAEKVPEDCSLLLLYGIRQDLREGEKKLLLDYLKAGGNAVIMPLYTGEDMPNLEEVMEYYGVTLQKGIIYEGAGHYDTYLNWIVPTANTSADILSGMKDGDYIVMADAQALKKADELDIRSSVKLTELLTTSKKSLLKVNPASGETKKEEGDLEGSFVTGVSAEESLDDGKKTRVVIYSTAQMQDSLLEDTIRTVVGAKSGDEGNSAASIDAKNLSYSQVTMNIGTQILWTILLVIIIPLGLLIIGFGIWFVRRRK